MKVYKDIVTGDEMVSDSYPQKLEYEDAILVVKSRLVTKGAEDFGIEDNDEEGGAGGSSDAVSVVDIVDAFGLQEITLSKGEFMAYVKAFLPKVKKYLEEQGKSERIPVFQKGATAFVKHLVEKFDEVQIYTGKEFNTDGAYAYCYYVNQEDAGPTFFYFIDGLKEEKF